MEDASVPYYRRTLFWPAVAGTIVACGVDYAILYLKEGGPWYREHLWGELALAIIPNIIAGLVAFLAVDFLIERKDQRERYIGAMRAIRLAAKSTPEPLQEHQMQELMVTSVKAISTLYFGSSKPPCSGKQFKNKKCTNCPNDSAGAEEDGSCSKCHEIPECWSVEP